MKFPSSEWSKAQKSLLDRMKEALETVGCKTYKDRYFLVWTEYIEMMNRMVESGFEVRNTRVGFNGTRTVLLFGDEHVYRTTSLRWFPDERFMQDAIEEMEEYKGSGTST